MVTLAKNLYTPGDKIEKIAAGYLITPKIPQGLAAAVEGLTREVIRHHPEDIYMFAAQHFQKLLQLREQYSRPTDQQWNVCQDASIYLDLKDYYKNFNESNKQFNDNKVTSKYANYNKLQKNEEYMKHKRKKAYGRDIKTRSPKVISGLMAANKDIKNKLKKNRMSTQQNKNGISRTDKVVLTKLDSMDKVKSYVVDKFAQTTGVDELQSMNYTAAVQNVIDSNTQVINKKIEELKGNKLITQQSKESNTETQNNNFNNSSVLESRLNETHNLLKDISSCFPKLGLQSRPRSADALHNYTNYCNASDKLEAMLNETHHLLLGISKNFLHGNELQKSKSEDNDYSNNVNLPSVHSTSIANSLNAQRNAAKNGSLAFALPPVTSSSPSPTDPPKSAKTKQDLTLPVLLPVPEIIPVQTDESDEHKQFKNIISENQHVLEADELHEDVLSVVEKLNTGVEITEIENHTHQETPESLCYMLTSTESPLFQIPYNVTTVIIPDRSDLLDGSHAHDQCLNDPFSSLIGEVVSATLTSEEMKELQPALELAAVMSNDKIKFHKQNLQCINEEDISDEFREDKVILEEIIDEENLDNEMIVKEIDEVKIMKDEHENFEKDNDLDSEPSSTTKETSATDGPLESPVIYEKTETGPTVSKSTDNVESSNEAKETTLTDGLSLLSLDDPVRPYVPELNLDSLQDITVSSFKMTEDECDLQPDDDNDRTNSMTETSTLNLNDSRDSEEIPVVDIDPEKSYIIENEVINGDVPDSSEEMQENICESQSPQEIQDVCESETVEVVHEHASEPENVEVVHEYVCESENVEVVHEHVNEPENVEIVHEHVSEPENVEIIHENVCEPENPEIVHEHVCESENLEDMQQNICESAELSEKQEDIHEPESLKEMQEDVCILETYVPTSEYPIQEISLNESIVIENEEEKVERNEDEEKIEKNKEENVERNEDEENVEKNEVEEKIGKSEEEELHVEQEETSEDDKIELKEQQTVIINNEEKSELDQDRQENELGLSGLDEINPSNEDSIVLKTLLTSQESLELHCMEDAVIVIQAGIRGFLARHRMRKIQKMNDSHDYTSAKDTSMQSEENQVESITEPEEEDMMKLQDTAAKKIQNNFRSYQTRKRLYRENAMQKTTTVSKEKRDSEESGLQHTGEFHDCIALPLHDIPMDAESINNVVEIPKNYEADNNSHNK